MEPTTLNINSASTQNDNSTFNTQILGILCMGVGAAGVVGASNLYFEYRWMNEKTRLIARQNKPLVILAIIGGVLAFVAGLKGLFSGPTVFTPQK